MKYVTGQKVHTKAKSSKQFPYYIIHGIHFLEDDESFTCEVFLKSPGGVIVEIVNVDDLYPLQEPSELLKEVL